MTKGADTARGATMVDAIVTFTRIRRRLADGS
jgi:hypothetical protein